MTKFVDKTYLGKFWKKKVLESPKYTSYDDLLTNNHTIIGAINELSETDVRLTQDIDDTARKILGGEWRIPTKFEWLELIENCDWEYTTDYDTAGWKVSKKNDSGTYIFLPLSGAKDDSAEAYEIDERGYYWASSIASNFDVYNMVINQGSYNTSDGASPWLGYTIRPVTTALNNSDSVDLGLPSGLRWALGNLTTEGIGSMSETGEYFAWGESKPKELYTDTNYRFNDNMLPYADDNHVYVHVLSTKESLNAKAYYNDKGEFIKLIDEYGNIIPASAAKKYYAGYGLDLLQGDTFSAEVGYKGKWLNEWVDVVDPILIPHNTLDAGNVWSDGENTYIDGGTPSQPNHNSIVFMYNPTTNYWEYMTWAGDIRYLKYAYLYNWTDGDNIYYTSPMSYDVKYSDGTDSSKGDVFVLNKRTKSWSKAPASLRLDEVELRGDMIIHFQGVTVAFPLNSNKYYRLDTDTMSWVGIQQTPVDGWKFRSNFFEYDGIVYYLPDTKKCAYQFDMQTLNFTSTDFFDQVYTWMDKMSNGSNIAHYVFQWGDVLYVLHPEYGSYKYENGAWSEMDWNNPSIKNGRCVYHLNNTLYYLKSKTNGTYPKNNDDVYDSYKLNPTTMEWVEEPIKDLKAPILNCYSNFLLGFKGDTYLFGYDGSLYTCKYRLKYDPEAKAFTSDFTYPFNIDIEDGSSLFELNGKYYALGTPLEDDSASTRKFYVYNNDTEEFEPVADSMNDILSDGYIANGYLWGDGEYIYYNNFDANRYKVYKNSQWITTYWSVPLPNIWRDNEGNIYTSLRESDVESSGTNSTAGIYQLQNGVWTQTDKFTGLDISETDGGQIWHDGQNTYYAYSHILNGTVWTPIEWVNAPSEYSEYNGEVKAALDYSSFLTVSDNIVKIRRHETKYNTKHGDKLQTLLTPKFGVEIDDDKNVTAEVEYVGQSHNQWTEGEPCLGGDDIAFQGGEYVWKTNGEYYYSYTDADSSEVVNLKFNSSSHLWESYAWSEDGFNPQDGSRVVTDNDGTSLYFDTDKVYRLNKLTNTWDELATYSDGFTLDQPAWVMGATVYAMKHTNTETKIYKWEGTNWSETTTTVELPLVLTSSFSCLSVWSDGISTYSSSDGKNYVYDDNNDIWLMCVIGGVSNFEGYNVWNQGSSTYLSKGGDHYKWDSKTQSWKQCAWLGLDSFYGKHIWSDDVNTYYTFAAQHYILPNTHQYATKHGDLLQEKLTAGDGINIDGNVISAVNSGPLLIRYDENSDAEKMKRIAKILIENPLRAKDVIYLSEDNYYYTVLHFNIDNGNLKITLEDFYLIIYSNGTVAINYH